MRAFQLRRGPGGRFPGRALDFDAGELRHAPVEARRLVRLNKFGDVIGGGLTAQEFGVAGDGFAQEFALDCRERRLHVVLLQVLENEYVGAGPGFVIPEFHLRLEGEEPKVAGSNDVFSNLVGELRLCLHFDAAALQLGGGLLKELFF